MRTHNRHGWLAIPLLTLVGCAGCPGEEQTCEPDHDVLINELMVNPDGQDTGREWVELYNAGDSEAAIGGWSLEWFKGDPDEASGDVNLPGDTVIPPGGFLVIGGEDVSPAPDVVLDLDLGNGGGGDGLHLLNCDGDVHDAVVYGDPENEDGILDESGQAATSVADQPGNDESLARAPDGADTNASGDDFGICGVPGGTPGETNENCGGGGSCDPASVPVTINELLVDPDGADDGQEWIELFNDAAAEVNVSGWSIVWYKGSMDSPDGVVLPVGTTIPAGGHLLIGDVLVDDTDVSLTLDMGQGTSGDAVWLLDCGEEFADGMAYGDDNDDQIEDAPGHVALTLAPKPGEPRTLARYPDGTDDDDSEADFCLCEAEDSTPGEPNMDCCGDIPTDGDLAGDVLLVINELLVDPGNAGGDAGYEWIELFNAGPNDANLSGWVLEWFKGSPTTVSGSATLPSGTVVPGGGLLLIGDSEVATADVTATLDMGQGSNGDAVHLLDGFDTFEDAVVYGDSNDDGMESEPGVLATTWAADPGPDDSLARVPDGHDTGDFSADFLICAAVGGTPGETNASCL